MPFRFKDITEQQPASSQRVTKWRLAFAMVVTTMGLAACSGYKPPAPSPLQANPATVAVSTAWTSRMVAEPSIALQPVVTGDQVILSDRNGNVQALQAATGAPLWQVQVPHGVVAGVGSDGTTAAVVTRESELVAVRGGAIAWRVPLQAQAYTAPYVAGGRVFVLTADRGISAYDAGNGFRLWQQKVRSGSENMVLRQNSFLGSMAGALLAGVSGRIVAFNPDTGAPLGESLIASPRGANDVDRLVDVLAPVSREGNSLCVRAYQAAVGCVDYARNAAVWTQPSEGSSGVSGDARMVTGTDNAGNVVAWSRADGSPLWKNTTLRYRQPGTPLVVGDNIVLADGQGYIHVLARDTGALRNRIATDGAPVKIAPVQAGNTIIVVGSKGVVTGLRLQ